MEPSLAYREDGTPALVNLQSGQTRFHPWQEDQIPQAPEEIGPGPKNRGQRRIKSFSSSPCPEVIFGALSRLTKRIRLGFGVVILPYHHPVRVAERVAMVDHLSHGRVDFGTGRSAPYEQTGMGIDPRNSREMWEESLSMIPKIWDWDTFQWEGKFWKVPPRQVLPKPYQKPHPPIWVVALQPATYQLAAEKGIGVMALGISAPLVLEPHIQAYRQNIQKAQPVGARVNNQWLNSIFGYCGEHNQAARELWASSL